MLDIKFIRDNQKEVINGLEKKSVVFALFGKKVSSQEFLKKIIELDDERLLSLRKYEETKAKQNDISQNIAKLSGIAKENKIKESSELKKNLGKFEHTFKTAEKELSDLMYKLPNLPFTDVPVGKSEADNVIIREAGEKRVFDFKPRDYIALGEALDLIDTERAGKVSGSRFGYLKHEAPLLEFALVQFVLSRLMRENYLSQIITREGISVSTKSFIPLIPPVMIRPEVYRGMGRLDPGQEEERYFLAKDDMYLVGSGEHTTGPMHMDEVFAEDKLPHRHIAFSTCFRREAGSYGKDTKGILRVHQFDKLEMFSFAKPQDSDSEHKLLISIQEAMMRELKIPYRLVFVCTGDMGWPDAKQYDIEAWLPGQNQYRETHSGSNTTDFQTRRLNIRYKNISSGKNELAHTLNATAFAIGRILIAILENYQNADGSVDVPSALTPYMHGISKILPRHKIQ